MSQLIADHGIWSDVGNWRDLVEYMIKLKIEDSERRKKRREQLDNTKNDNNWNFGIGLKSSIVNTSILTDGFKGLKKLMQSSEEKQTITLQANASLIFNELSNFVAHFINLNLSYEKAHEVLYWACNKYQVERAKTHMLLTELKSNQKNPSKMFTEHE